MPPDTIAQAHRDYLKNQSMVTSPTEVVQMLYQVAINNVRSAIDLLNSGDAFARARVVTKAEEAVDELLLSLDHSVGAPFTRTLEDLYRYILDQIVKGHARQSEQAFRDALTILESLADTWTQVRAKLSAEAEAVEHQPAKEVVEEAAHAASDSYSAYSSNPVTSGRDWSA
jgi:flagellar biosynthetic protein FliS